MSAVGNIAEIDIKAECRMRAIRISYPPTESNYLVVPSRDGTRAGMVWRETIQATQHPFVRTVWQSGRPVGRTTATILRLAGFSEIAPHRRLA